MNVWVVVYRKPWVGQDLAVFKSEGDAFVFYNKHHWLWNASFPVKRKVREKKKK